MTEKGITHVTMDRRVKELFSLTKDEKMYEALTSVIKPSG